MARITNKVTLMRKPQDGTSITITYQGVMYSYSANGQSPPLAGWQSSIPAVPQGQYLWTRTEVMYSDGKSTISYTAARQGEDGAQGAPGTPGSPGGRGDRGPMLRGPMKWDECANGFVFQAGGANDSYLDYVVYNGNYYMCTTSHTKSSSWVSSYWQSAAQLPFVASTLMLATYAVIKNLGVESIEMKDAAGNVAFVAKNGDVTCRTGTFNGVLIQSGTISGFVFDNETQELYAGKAGSTNNMLLSRNLIRFRNPSGDTAIYIGANTFPASGGSALQGPLRVNISRVASEANANVGAFFDVSGCPDTWDLHVGAGNHALLIPRGHITGFRARTRRTSSSMTLDVLDTNIITTNTSAITLTLPSASAEDGQEYRIFSANGGKVNMSAGSGYTISGSGASFQTAHWQVYIFDKYNKTWLYSYMN